MEKLHTYLSLCTEVYDLSKPEPPKDAYSFYREYAKQVEGLILEPMCGTGRFLLPLVEEGFDVHCYDASDNMLQALYNKASIKKLKPTVWKGFIESLATKQLYKLIFIPSGSFCLITDLSTIKSTLRKFFDHLEKGGVLLFEVETSHSLPPLGIWRGSKWDRSHNKKIILSQFAVLDSDICTSIGRYDLIDNHQVIQTEIEEYKIKLYEEDELKSLLNQAGFSDVRAIKAFNRNALPEVNDESIVYQCIK